MNKSWFDDYDTKIKTSAFHGTRALDSLPKVETTSNIRGKSKQENMEIDKAMLQNVKMIIEHVDNNLHHVFDFHSDMILKQVELMQGFVSDGLDEVVDTKSCDAIVPNTTGNHTIVVIMEPNQIQQFIESKIKEVSNHTTLPYFIPKTDAYIVQKGDTLSSIARMFHTTVDELKKINNLSTDTLYIGQKIIVNDLDIIPTQESEQILYIVDEGDSLWSIAKRYRTTTMELKRLNHLVNNHLRIGQSLQVPNMLDKTPQTSTMDYTVQSSDTLWSIARRYHTTVDAIKELNDLTSNLLTTGQRIQIPTDSYKGTFTYVVVPGDSLWSIAKQFGTTVSDIKRLNHITNDTLSVRQQLQIPNN